MTEPLPDGVHSFFEYRPDPTRLSPRGIKKLLPPSTPARFLYDMTHPEKPKPAYDFGTVAHKLVLGEGDQFLVLDPQIHGLKKDGAVADNPRATGAWKDAEANARAEGLAPIHVDDYRKAVHMAQVVHAHPTAGRLFSDGHAEVWMYWTDTQTGQGLRQRLDWMRSPKDDERLTIVEYKTTVDASPDAFARTAFRFGYHLSAACAILGAKALKLDAHADYVIVAQEKEPPHQVAIYRFDAEAFSYSVGQLRAAISTFQRCTAAGEWPGYATGVRSIPLPAWAEHEMEFAT